MDFRAYRFRGERRCLDFPVELYVQRMCISCSEDVSAGINWRECGVIFKPSKSRFIGRRS
jgi:hypothetical protein